MRPPAVFLLWGALMAAIGVCGLLFFGFPDPEEPALFGGTVFGLFAAIYYWFPKVTGRLLGETLGRWQAALMFVGGLLAFIPMFLLGHDGMPRRVANWDDPAWRAPNIVATVGAYMIALAMVLFVVNVLRSLRVGRLAGADPWEGQTLEWATSSPPPRENFDVLPPVRGYAPLLDLRHDGREPQEVLGELRERRRALEAVP